MDEGEDLVEVKTFLDRNLALDYIKKTNYGNKERSRRFRRLSC